MVTQGGGKLAKAASNRQALGRRQDPGGADQGEMQPSSSGDMHMATEAERNWGMAALLSALAGFVIPFGSIIGPLVVWLVKKDEIPFVNSQGKEALNFQITIAIGAMICFVLMLIIIGFFLLWALVVFDLVFIVIAAVQASKGVDYRYPYALRLIN
jgi:uncharacterized Tic20 family protein